VPPEPIAQLQIIAPESYDFSARHQTSIRASASSCPQLGNKLTIVDYPSAILSSIAGSASMSSSDVRKLTMHALSANLPSMIAFDRNAPPLFSTRRSRS